MRIAVLLGLVVALVLIGWLALRPDPEPDPAEPPEASTGTEKKGDSPPGALPDPASGEATANGVPTGLEPARGPGATENPSPSSILAEKPTAKPAGLGGLLKSSKVTLNLQDADLLEALATVTSQLGVSLEVAPGLKAELEGRKISLSVTDLEANSTLELIIVMAGSAYAYSVKDGKVFVHRR